MTNDTRAGELIATLHGGRVARPDRDALEDFVLSGEKTPLKDFLAVILVAVDRRETVHLLAVPAGDSGGFESRRELVAAAIYNARAQSPREMTPERWADVKRRFGASARACLEQADEEIGDFR